MKNIPPKIYLQATPIIPPDNKVFLGGDFNDYTWAIGADPKEWGLEYTYNGGWISIENELPKPGKVVIVWDSYASDVCTAYKRHDGWMRVGGDRVYPDSFITHWQPIPSPPKLD